MHIRIDQVANGYKIYKSPNDSERPIVETFYDESTQEIVTKSTMETKRIVGRLIDGKSILEIAQEQNNVK